ncbi:hypothetical protein MSPP1_001878 [Malassezia sp. CBS 17886]|nr:hypothetical protein MSPP1_001878 [Malassezia sp. CBS 17886]
MSMGLPGQSRRLGVRNQKLRAPRSHGLALSGSEMWARLSVAIAQIQNHNISQLSYEEHYRYAYNLILNQQGEMLYDGVRKHVGEHLEKQRSEQIAPLFPLDAAMVQAATDVFPRGAKGRAPGAPPATGAPPAAIAGALGLLPAQGAQTDDILAGIPAAERFLSAVSHVWEDHCSCMGKLRDVLKYVDRVYVPSRGELPVWDLGMDLFRDTVVRSERVPVHQNLIATLLRQIHCEREGASVERGTIKVVADMLLALMHPTSAAPRSTVYRRDFEPIFLATSSEYFACEAARLLAEGNATHYLQQVEARMADEEARCLACLNAGTLPYLRTVLELHLLTEHLDAVIAMPDGGLVALLEGDRRDDLDRMYRLVRTVPSGLPVLGTTLRAYATERGNAINEATTRPAGSGSDSAQLPAAVQWVDDVLALKERLDGMLYTSFQGNKSCETAVNEAFDVFVNRNARAPEYLSLFIDEHLKKGAKMRSDEEMDVVLSRTIVLFRFVHEKDMFERYYKLHLTRRLLHGRSASDDAERGMIAKLKIECGHGYVQKLQGMLNDMKLSQDMLTAFHAARQREGTEQALEMNVNVLTATYWPVSAPKEPCVLPLQLAQACEAFEAFYGHRHRGRMLTWQPHLGSAEVRVRFRARSHDLVVSTYALIVLLLFQDVPDGGSLTYEELRAGTNIPDGDLQRTLQSLACAKYKVLLKEPRGRDVRAGDRFLFHASFTCPLARIKIAQVAAKVETPAERKETTAKVEEERKSQVEACIVRVMKSRKSLSHNDLVNEVVRQLMPRFQPTPALIKKRIESLLDREYLECIITLRNGPL